MKWGWVIATVTMWVAMWAAVSPAAENTVSTTVLAETPENTASAPEQIYKGSITVGMIGKRFNDEVVNSAYGRGALAIEFTGSYQDWLRGRFRAGQVYSSGATSNLYAVTEGNASTFAFLDEASLTFVPLSAATLETRLSGGVLPIRQNPILTALWEVNSWTAGRLELEQKGDDGRVVLTAQQAIPSGTDISNRLIDEDTLPLYTNASLFGEVGIFNTGWKIGATAASFVFTDPSSAAAASSMKIGSTTFGNGKSVLFAYDYRGVESAMSLGYTAPSGDTLGFSVSDLRNELAPSGRANLAKAEFKRVGNKWDYTTALTGFRIESDSVPAIFVNPGFGFTNRIGGTLSLKAEQRKERFSLGGAYTRAVVLNTDALSARDGYQADRDIFTLSAEFKHDLF